MKIPTKVGIFLSDISKDLQHALCRLLFGIDPVFQLSIFIIFYDHVLWRWDQAVLDAPITTDLVLVSARMKKAHVQGFVPIGLG